jgi:ABC-2 type transport system permease protein
MRAALLIARKDLRQRTRDKSAYIFGIVAPLGLAIIFSFIFTPIQDAVFHADYVVVDLDGGDIAEAFGDSLGAIEDEGIATITYVETIEEAEERVEAGSDPFTGEDVDTADAAFIIPEGFSEAALAGQASELEIMAGASADLSAQVAVSIAQGFAAELQAVQVAVTTALPTAEGEPDPRVIGVLALEAAEYQNPVSVEDVSASTKQLNSSTYLAAGMAIFFLFFTVSFGVSGLLEERRDGTMDRLLAAPISRTSIILGKALTSFALGIVSMAVLVIATTFLIDAQWGDPAGVALLVLGAVLAAMGILGLVAAFAKTPESASNMQAIIALVLAFLGGTFFTISQVGGFLEQLSLLTPHAWFLRGLGDLQGGDVGAVWPAFFALLGFAFITMAIAYPFLKRSVNR